MTMHLSSFPVLWEAQLNVQAPRLVPVPSGWFLMGSPPNEPGRCEDEAQRIVKIQYDFWMSETPCTQELWQAVMGYNPSENKGDKLLPVENVSWHDCQEFCARLNALFADFSFRLPTEAEWEYACRAGTSSPFNDGSNCVDLVSSESILNELGWFECNAELQPRPVGLKKPNAWGLYDMHGNVWEWCQEWCQHWGDEAYILRGGSWGSPAMRCRSAIRSALYPSIRLGNCGFRFMVERRVKGVKK